MCVILLGWLFFSPHKVFCSFPVRMKSVCNSSNSTCNISRSLCISVNVLQAWPPKDTSNRTLSFLVWPSVSQSSQRSALHSGTIWFYFLSIVFLSCYNYPLTFLSFFFCFLILSFLLSVLSHSSFLGHITVVLAWHISTYHFYLERLGLCCFQTSLNKLSYMIFIENICFQGSSTEEVTLLFHSKVRAV